MTQQIVRSKEAQCNTGQCNLVPRARAHLRSAGSKCLGADQKDAASGNEIEGNDLKVIPLYCIAHPYCARFLCVISARSQRAHVQGVIGFPMRLSSPEKRMVIDS